MADAGARFCGKKVLLVRRKKAHDGGRLEGWRVGKVNHDLGALQCRLQAFPRHSVDARVRRGGQHIMPGAAQARHDFRADTPGASNDDNLHFSSERVAIGDARSSAYAGSSRQAADALALLVFMKASRSGFTTLACVVHMPWGNFS